MEDKREQRIARRKAEGYNNPKKDKWAKRKFRGKPEVKSWDEIREEARKRIELKK